MLERLGSIQPFPLREVDHLSTMPVSLRSLAEVAAASGQVSVAHCLLFAMTEL